MTTQQRFEEWLGFKYDLPDCLVVPIQSTAIGYNNTMSHLLNTLGGAFDPITTGDAERLRAFLQSDESLAELRLCNMTYSSDAEFDEDSPPYCQAVVKVGLGNLRRAMRVLEECDIVGVVLEPYDVRLFTMDWEDIDAGRYGNFNELYIPKWDTNRISLTMTHKDNPQCYIKFDNV